MWCPDVAVSLSLPLRHLSKGPGSTLTGKPKPATTHHGDTIRYRHLCMKHGKTCAALSRA